ncbi:MAG: PKD domain-containing protein, partial [Bacteroidetes bacterium]
HRINRNDAGWVNPPYSVSYTRNVIMPQAYWDPERYINIWVLPLNTGVLGYAQMPNGSPLPDLPADNGGAASDGVIITSSTFGRGAGINPPYNGGRTTTHEMGHFLGLWHTWGDGPCGVEDFCPDTPDADGATYGCPAGGRFSCGQSIQIENYLDYTDDACMNVFTACQKSRMRTVLAAAPRRVGLVSSDVCNAVAPLADFEAAPRVLCPGASVRFTDLSSGNPLSRLWSFPGGSPASSSEISPVVTYQQPGFYDVSLQVSNSAGSNSLNRSAWVQVRAASDEPIFVEDFEDGLAGWTVQNADNQISWSAENTGGLPSGVQSAGISLYYYSNQLQRDGLISPEINLRPFSDISLEFDYAYRTYFQKRDSLIIYASVDGGQSWPWRLFAKAENGSKNFATNEPVTSAFIPATSADWCSGGSGWAACPEISLAAFDTAAHFRLKFEALNNYGNNLYLDNIRISGACKAPVNSVDPQENALTVRVLPNPNQGYFTLQKPAVAARWSVYDAWGKCVLSGAQVAGAVSENIDIRMEGAARGVYLMVLQTEQGRAVCRFQVE